MLKLPCHGVLCKEGKQRFHMTCLYCRARRKQGKYRNPVYWIKYTYLSWYAVNLVKEYVDDGKVYCRSDGGWMRVYHPYTLQIDPRGKFTRFRCAVIVLIDKFMVKFGSSYSKIVYNRKGEVVRRGYAHGLRKPFAELCEFFANYP